MARVSIVIPCYNDGQHLVEAVRAAKAQTGVATELVVVDDHSTDARTLAVLESLRAEGCAVLRTPEGRKGVSAARNAGIAATGGEYLLCLDADDSIEPDYAAKAAAVLDAEPDVRLCYCDAACFGDVRRRWRLPAYRFEELLFDNCIFCSALFRRSDWAAVGGYDEGLVLGLEDWALWLAILARGGRAHRIPETLFHCRIRKDSRTTRMKARGEEEAVLAVFESQRALYEENAGLLFRKLRELRAGQAAHRLLLFRLLRPLFFVEERLRALIPLAWARLRALLVRPGRP